MPAVSPATVITKLAQLRADAALHRERIMRELDPSTFESPAALAAWLKTELAFNLYPMFEASVTAIEEDVLADLDDLGTQVDALLESEGESISEVTAQQIYGVCDAGRDVCALLERVTKSADTVTRSRATRAIRQYRALEMQLRPVIESLVVVDDEDQAGAIEGDGEGAVDGGEAVDPEPEPSPDELEPGDDVGDDGSAGQEG
jgi:hypothetical protein